MTVSTTTSKVSYSGNGSTTAFAYTFKVFDEDDLTVILRDDTTGTETTQTITTDYTVSGVGNTGGGNVTFVTAPASGKTVVIRRESAQTQTTDYTPNDPFPAEAHEDALDKLTFIAQEVQEELDRAIKISRTNTMTSTEFTVGASARANKILAFDSSGEIAVTQEIGTFVGNWSTGTTFNQRDIVKDTSTNNIFIANTTHTSSGSQPLTTNTDSAKWDLLVDAASATTSATNAANSATAAATSATNAATSASSASSSASTATTQASNASSSATAAAASAAAAAASADDFTDRYYGAHANDSAAETYIVGQGLTVDTGDLYFNTTANITRVYNGTSWDNVATSTSGFLTSANNLSDVSSASTALSNLSGLSTTGGTLTGDLNFGDNDKAIFGAGNDLQIFHDGSNSYVLDDGTGNLVIQSSGANIQLASSPYEIMLRGNTNGSVELFYDGSKKLETTSTGVTVTGTAIATTQTASATGAVTLDFGANQNFVLTLTGNVTLSNPTTEQVGQSGFIVFIQDGTGGRTVSLGTDYETAGGAGITLSTAASTTDVVPYIVAASGRILLGTPQLAFA